MGGLSTVPNSGGNDAPLTPVPPNACDAHMHVYDARYARACDPGVWVERATAEDYRLLQGRIGTERTVVVQPRAHGTDNSVTLAAIQSLGPQRTRGIAVVHPGVSDDELARLHEGGIRGVRFTLYTAAHAATDFSMVEPIARRVHALGWHVQLHWTADQVVEHADLLARLPGTVVFDHLARPSLSDPQAHPSHGIVSRMLDGGRTWIKLSGAYLNSNEGAEGRYGDTDRIARRWISQAPERMVWGSDWPHPTERGEKPDDAALLDLLDRWAPDRATRDRILVDNPSHLYQFP